MFPVLGVLIVVIAILGLQEKPEYSNSELPGYESLSPKYINHNTDYIIEWDKRILARIYIVEQTNTETYYLFTSQRSSVIKKSDLLFYINKNGSNKISEESLFIGKYPHTQKGYSRIPLSVLNRSTIILYSLSKKEIISIGKVVKQEDAE